MSLVSLVKAFLPCFIFFKEHNSFLEGGADVWPVHRLLTGGEATCADEWYNLFLYYKGFTEANANAHPGCSDAPASSRALRPAHRGIGGAPLVALALCPDAPLAGKGALA